MIENLTNFAQMCHFLPEATAALLESERLLLERTDAAAQFPFCRDLLFASDGDPWPALDVLAQQAGMHRFIVHMLFLIYCAPETQRRYALAGLPEDLYWDSMKDMKYKMEITHNMYDFGECTAARGFPSFSPNRPTVWGGCSLRFFTAILTTSWTAVC